MDIGDGDSENVELSLLTLPSDVLVAIASHLIPSAGFHNSSTKAWANALLWCAVSKQCEEALGLALVEIVPSLANLSASDQPASRWCSLVGRLNAGGCGRWMLCSPLRAVRPERPHLHPVQTAPRLSGASLCALVGGGGSESLLCLFGGRASASADTSCKTYLISVSWPSPSRSVAVWDQLLGETHPPARCYHSASSCSWDGSMVIFGGAGDEEGAMYNDIWSLEVTAESTRAAAPTPAPRQWRQLEPLGAPPAPRSSHVCVSWPEQRSLIVHGGLGNDGVTGDVWLLLPPDSASATASACEWLELETSGPSVPRAHHCAGLIGSGDRSALLVYSGQDERLLTVHNLATLTLSNAAWEIVNLPNARPARSLRGGDGRSGGASSDSGNEEARLKEGAVLPVGRIDAGGTTIPGVGLLVFGGVGDDFGFVEPANAWLLRNAHDTTPTLPVAPSLPLPPVTPNATQAAPADPTIAYNRTFSTKSAPPKATPAKAPRARACLGMCADGLRVYTFGGFDGEQDLDDLWCLSLLPPGLATAAPLNSSLRAGSRSATGHGPLLSSAAAAASVWPGRTQEEMAGALEAADEIKRRRSHQANVLHATPGANGANFIPIHVLVGQAARAWDAMQDEQRKSPE